MLIRLILPIRLTFSIAIVLDAFLACLNYLGIKFMTGISTTIRTCLIIILIIYIVHALLAICTSHIYYATLKFIVKLNY